MLQITDMAGMRKVQKIGNAINFQNVHLCYDERSDSFYYKKDTLGVYSSFVEFGYHQTVLEYIKDSTIINAKYIDRNDTVCIYCDKKTGCKMTRGNDIIKEFPFADFEGN